MMTGRTAYPSDIRDEEWELVRRYLELLPEKSCQRRYPIREVFNAIRYVAHTGGQWRQLPHDFPPWPVVYQQMRRWLEAGVFEQLMQDVRDLLRELDGRIASPSACVLDSRTLQSTPESGARSGFDAAKRRKGTKVHLAVDTLGYPLATEASAANEQDRDHVESLTQQVQEVTGGQVKKAFADQAYSGESAAQKAQAAGMELVIVKREAGQKGFVVLPKRWVVERSFGWIARCRRLLRDFERLTQVLIGFHLIAFAGVMLRQLASAAFTIAFWT